MEPWRHIITRSQPKINYDQYDTIIAIDKMYFKVVDNNNNNNEHVGTRKHVFVSQLPINPKPITCPNFWTNLLRDVIVSIDLGSLITKNWTWWQYYRVLPIIIKINVVVMYYAVYKATYIKDSLLALLCLFSITT